jgi:hypothetical protein
MPVIKDQITSLRRQIRTSIGDQIMREPDTDHPVRRGVGMPPPQSIVR